MANRIPKGLDGLPGKGASRGIGDRDRENDRPAHPTFLKDLLAGKDRCLEVQRVKDRFEQEQIHTAVKKGLDLLAVGNHKAVKGDSAVAGVIHVR